MQIEESESPRAFIRAIESKPPLDQLALLRERVDHGEMSEDDRNILRRRYIRLASELYRGIYTQ